MDKRVAVFKNTYNDDGEENRIVYSMHAAVMSVMVLFVLFLLHKSSAYTVGFNFMAYKNTVSTRTVCT